MSTTVEELEEELGSGMSLVYVLIFDAVGQGYGVYKSIGQLDPSKYAYVYAYLPGDGPTAIITSHAHLPLNGPTKEMSVNDMGDEDAAVLGIIIEAAMMMSGVSWKSLTASYQGTMSKRGNQS